MVYSLSPASPETLKAEARALCDEQARLGTALTYSAALERISRQHGYRDWNTARAALKERVACPVRLGQHVSGVYLKRSFTGTVLAAEILPGNRYYRLTVDFDEPVDVVTFDSFSAFRKRVRCRVDAYGVSPDTTGDGHPHMRLKLSR